MTFGGQLDRDLGKSEGVRQMGLGSWIRTLNKSKKEAEEEVNQSRNGGREIREEEMVWGRSGIFWCFWEKGEAGELEWSNGILGGDGDGPRGRDVRFLGGSSRPKRNRQIALH